MNVPKEWELTEETSNGSRSIAVSAGATKPDTLCDLFGIDNRETFRDAYKQVTGGQGNEERRIMTLHSSALLTLLVFYGVSENNPLTVDGVKYTKCFFEATNKVFDRPSSVDVVLLSEDKNTMLFLESKFTEYTKHGKYTMSQEYKTFYDYISKNGQLPIKIVPAGEKRALCYDSEKGKRQNAVYLEGIKQCFSHLIGLAKGPVEESGDYRDSFYKAKELRFGTILFDCDSTELAAYTALYESTIAKVCPKTVMKALPEGQRENCDRIQILPTTLRYQDVFKNTSFVIPAKVRAYYKLD